MIGHWWLHGRNWPSLLSQKAYQFSPIQKVPKKYEIFQAPNYNIRKKFLVPQKKFFWMWVYGMENKNTKTDYQEVVRVGYQKWEIVEITVRIIFYAWDSYPLFFVYAGNFQVPPEKKSPPPRKPIPTQNPNFTHKPSEKWLSPPLHHPGGMQTMKSPWICQCIFLIAIKL